MTMQFLGSAIAAAVLAGSAGATISFTSNPGIEGLGAFTGSMTWTYLGGGAGTLGISLTNTSPSANGGFLTGFAFNTVNGVGVTLTSGRAGFAGMTNVAASPFENFDFGAALGGSWIGGGSPTPGIGVGVTDSFVFGVSGSSSLLASLTDLSFFDMSGGDGFAARFRGFAGGGSDKVTATPTPPQVVPLPQTLALATGGLLGLLLLRRRK